MTEDGDTLAVSKGLQFCCLGAHLTCVLHSFFSMIALEILSSIPAYFGR